MEHSSQVINIPIEDIIPNRFQPRLSFDETALKELSKSIIEHGVIQPLIVRKLGDKFEIIAGERRYKASKLAGLLKVPCIISTLDDKKSAEVAIVENIQRKDLTPIEEAKSYKILLDKGLTQEELAKKMGLSQSSVANKLRLLNLPEKVQDYLMIGRISERHARSLLLLNNVDLQLKYLDIIVNERLTVKELDKRIKEELDSNIEKEIVKTEPSIDEIREKSEDLVVEKPLFELPKEEKKDNKIEMKNKYFNFLEDYQANMETVEEQEPEEEIELLDFDISKPEKNFNEVDDLLDNIKNQLQEKNYQVKIDKLKDPNKLTITIEIE